MTRDEAIKGLHRILGNYYRVCNEHLLNETDVAEEINSLNMAIEALSAQQEVRTQMSSADCINRQDAIDGANEIIKRDTSGNNAVVEAMKAWKAYVGNLPSANQWILCSERLPQENGRYLVTRGLNACGSLWNRVYIVNYSDLMGLKKEKICLKLKESTQVQKCTQMITMKESCRRYMIL